MPFVFIILALRLDDCWVASLHQWAWDKPRIPGRRTD